MQAGATAQVGIGGDENRVVLARFQGANGQDEFLWQLIAFPHRLQVSGVLDRPESCLNTARHNADLFRRRVKQFDQVGASIR